MAAFYLIATWMVLPGLLVSYCETTAMSAANVTMCTANVTGNNTLPGPKVILKLTVNITCRATLNVSVPNDIKTVYTCEGFPIKSVIIWKITCNITYWVILKLWFYSGIPTGKTIEGVFQAALKDGKITNLTESNTIYNLTFTGETAVTSTPTVTGSNTLPTTVQATPSLGGTETTAMAGGTVTTAAGGNTVTSAVGGGTATTAVGGGTVTTAAGGNTVTSAVGGGTATTAMRGGSGGTATVTTTAVGGGGTATVTTAMGGGGTATVTTTVGGGGGGTVTTAAASGGGGSTVATVMGSGVGGTVTTAAGGGGKATATTASGGAGGGATVTATAGGGVGGANSTAAIEAMSSGGGGGTATTVAGGGGISPSTTTTTIISSVSPEKEPGPTVILTLIVTTNCSDDNLLALNVSVPNDVKSLYTSEGLLLKSVIIQSISCNSPINITLKISFYSGIPSGKTIKGVFQAALKGGKITNLTESNTIFTVTFTGVTIKYNPKAGQCQAICCGVGGALTVERVCTPENKCEGIEPDEKEEEGHCPKEEKGTCTDVCDDDDGSGGIHNSPSYALVTLLAIATFKTMFF